MDEPHQPMPDRRADDVDDELFAPRKSGEIVVPPRAVLARPSAVDAPGRFEPPVSALGPLFRYRLEQIHLCRVNYSVDINTRPTVRVLGGYYKSRRLVRIYPHDRLEGRRPLVELFDTFLHEIAHHLEYTEPRSFSATRSYRVYGLMHSRLFWRILGELKYRWAEAQLGRTHR
ncbi:MAG TPA: hypothetical protein VKA15_22775 [Isosphaeraceae bacterium]|nr:hypothetical protein [Isosphaeraceae bacterium]